MLVDESGKIVHKEGKDRQKGATVEKSRGIHR